MLVAKAGPVRTRGRLLLDVDVQRVGVERRAVVEDDVGPQRDGEDVKSSFDVIDWARYGSTLTRWR